MDNRIECDTCQASVENTDIFTCFICSVSVCHECASYVGMWKHTKKLCDFCNGCRHAFHSLNYICSRNCELIYLLRYTLTIVNE